MSTTRGEFVLPFAAATADPTAPALIDADGVLTYGMLTAAVRDRAGELMDEGGRRLVHLPLMRGRRSVVDYLAVVAAGHVALVTDSGPVSQILDSYEPDARSGPSGEWVVSPQATHVLHPDLTVLLSTSGSTGSPKLVRLSAANLTSNADAIAAALGLTPDDRAITSLPLHYCYGLSVLNAHLSAGAAIVLHGGVTESFAQTLAEHRVTTLALTPHLLDLLQVQGVLTQDLPDLRIVTQAGGALHPDRVLDVARLGRRQGWELWVMYGQTEATARMAVLPPELAVRYPDAVGWPIGGSRFRLDRSVVPPDEAADGVGELVFAGPGVMMGYAEHRDDLALPAMVTELRTGDLGTIDGEGLVRIVGRRSGFVKIMGIRIDLAQVERSLDEQGVVACVTGDDHALRVTFVARSASPDAADVRLLAARAAGVGVVSVLARPVDALPLLPGGKVDRQACAADPETESVPAAADPASTDGEDALVRVTAVLAPLLGRPGVDPDRSFAELGGDSFSHVQASVRLTRLLPGRRGLPPDWHHRSLRELAELVRPPHPGRGRWLRVETCVALRALAVVMICGSHVGLFPLAGGAHILVAVAGFSYARYIGPAGTRRQRWRRTARTMIGIAIPSVLVAGAMKLFAGAGDWPRVFMLHWLLQPEVGNVFWFVESLLVITLAVTALLSVPVLHRAAARDPWAFAFTVCLLALVPRYLVIAFGEGLLRGLPWTVGWLFAAGMAMALAGTTRRRFVTLSVAVVATIGFFPHAERNLVIMIGLTLLGTVVSVPLPRLLTRPVEIVGAASLYVYLIQFQMFTYSDVGMIKFVLSLATGLLFWALVHPLVRRAQLLVAHHVRERPNP